MLNEFIKNLQKSMKEQYPQLESSPAMRAVITAARQSAETYSEKVRIQDHTTGETHDCTIESPYYIYTVHPADNSGRKSDKYPAIPGVKAKGCYAIDSVVTIVFLGGEMYPAIVGD